MKKKWIIILAILIIGIAIAIYYYFFGGGKPQNTVAFITTKPQYGYIAKSITATGTIQPVDTVSVGAQVSGVVKKVYVDFNSVVKKGQLLAQIDQSILTAQVNQSKATLASAKSNMQLQKNTFDRQNKLFNLGAISKADYQVALNQYNSAKAAVDNTIAQLHVTEKTLSYTNIYSPVDGTILNRNVSEGQTIASSFSAPTLFVIAKDLTKMQVSAAVDEADIGGVVAGQTVSFTVDAFPDDIFRGIVLEVLLHATVTSNVVTYKTLINVDNQNLKLKPGMTASINIYSQEDSNAFLIPSRVLTFKPDSVLLKKFTIINANKQNTPFIKKSKLITDSQNIKIDSNEVVKQSYVWVKTGDTLTQRLITTGLNDDTNVKVIDGLSPTDEVITSAAAATKAEKTTAAQQSPFMPTMGRKKTTTPPKK